MRTMRYPKNRIRYKFGQNKKRDAFVILLIVALVVGSFIYSQLQERSALAAASMKDGECELHMIDVGQGDAFLLRAGDDTVLVDTGTGEAEDQLYDYLTRHGVTSLDYVIFSHPHEDHIGNGDMIMECFDVENVIMPDVTADTACFEDLLEAIYATDARVHMSNAGDTYTAGDISLKILGPFEMDPDEPNNCSIVMRVEYGDVSMLFSGDAEKVVEYQVLEKYADEVDCDIYKVAHHGSSTSNSDKFVETASPGIALISCGFGNTYGHPHREVISKLDEMGVTVRRTDVDGDVVVATDGEKYWLKEE